ncbi:tRNA pseudouridine synthase A [Salmonella enterica subsp. enterica]|uniref:tRNA pseudouridine synthase n=1 Tax=Salmonella enterica I TaxID=59201 RepID=A0A447P6N7_SALET|nr:tRNA pseudouridine synthase A [Salmonella enterica subsp. enterica]
MSGQQSSPVYKLRWVLSTTAASIMAGSVRMKCAACRKSWKSALGRWQMNLLTCSAPGVPMPAFTAPGQVVHFETTALRKDAAWTLGVNANLPGDIAVRWVKTVPDDFHARFSATARRYRYIIYNHRLRPAVLAKGVTHYYEPLDAERMHRAAQCLLGENDFTSFRAVQCQSRTPWRNVMHINVTRHGPYVVVDIKANAFVHHMVRNIVGSLLEVGAHNQPESWIAELLAGQGQNAGGGNGEGGRAIFGCGGLP